MKRPGVPKTSYVPRQESKPGEIRYRWDVINHVIKSCGFARYLEIGVCGYDLHGNKAGGECFQRIKIAHKDGIDPAGAPANHQMSSDDFFTGIGDTDGWDCVFIDGEHHPGQLKRDFFNAYNRVPIGGVVFIHDAYPNPEYFVDKHIIGGGRGIVWTVTASIALSFAGMLKLMTLKLDNGIAIIQKIEDIDESDFKMITDIKSAWENVDTLVNVITVEQLKRMYK